MLATALAEAMTESSLIDEVGSPHSSICRMAARAVLPVAIMGSRMKSVSTGTMSGSLE